MYLPNRIFFTGVPGSKWSSVAQCIEALPGFNTTDRQLSREYRHHSYSGHKGAYFGTGMEFEAVLDGSTLDAPWLYHDGCKLTKSHEWAYMLPEIKVSFPHDWIMLVYRPDTSSLSWWLEAGGFQIPYPCYSHYENEVNMFKEIQAQNTAILNFGSAFNCTWEYFTESWLQKTFGATTLVPSYPDILVAVIK